MLRHKKTREVKHLSILLKKSTEILIVVVSEIKIGK